MLDDQILGVSGLHHGSHILRLVDGHRGQGPQLLCHDAHQAPGALSGAGGNLVQLAAGFFHMSPQPLQIIGLRIHDVGLVSGHNHGPVTEIDAVVLQLGADGIEILHRIPALAAGHVNHMNQKTAAVDVAQEIVAQAGTFGSTLNDAGDVSHDEGHALVHENHAQVGEQGGEVVVGDFGPGVGGDGQQGGFAHVGEAHQAHVSQQLQLQDDIPLLALQAGFGEPGDLTGGSGKVAVAPAAAAALGDDEVLTGRHVHDDLLGFGVPDHSAPGDLDNQRFTTLAAHVPACAVGTALGGVLTLVAEVQQGGQIVVDPEDDAAAMAAVTAVRAAGSHIFFPVEGHGTVAAPATDNGDTYFIYEHRKTSLVEWFDSVMNNCLVESS